MPPSESRIQFVVSGPFLFLLLISAGLMTAGFWLYTHPPPPIPVIGPPYFINKVTTAVRACFQCVAPDGKLKPQTQWKLGKTISIPDKEQWWFSPVDRAAEAITVDRVPMLAVHPAIKNDAPWEGFDQRRVLLVVFQDLDPRFSIEHPAPSPPPPPPVADPAPAQAPPTDPASGQAPDPNAKPEEKPTTEPPKQEP
jgi:hypothetical protein